VGVPSYFLRGGCWYIAFSAVYFLLGSALAFLSFPIFAGVVCVCLSLSLSLFVFWSPTPIRLTTHSGTISVSIEIKRSPDVGGPVCFCPPAPEDKRWQWWCTTPKTTTLDSDGSILDPVSKISELLLERMCLLVHEIWCLPLWLLYHCFFLSLFEIDL
jgi:hypothetical protein